MNIMLDRLVSLCLEGRWLQPQAVVREPYVPYIPTDWNRILVLAEAQNLGSTKGYIKLLRELPSPERRVRRLYESPDRLHVGPWDDGTLKLAVAAAFGLDAVEHTGVGNRVFWSLAKDDRNLSPTPEMQDSSVELWKAILDLLLPNLVVTAGKVAEKVLKATGFPHVLSWKPPFMMYLSRVSGLIRESDLLVAFPTVREAMDVRPQWVREYRQNKVFFACHAVSCSHPADAK